MMMWHFFMRMLWVENDKEKIYLIVTIKFNESAQINNCPVSKLQRSVVVRSNHTHEVICKKALFKIWKVY